MSSQPRKQLNGVAIIAVSSVFFGVMAIVTRLLAGVVPSAQVVTVRFAVGALGCLVWFIATRTRPQVRRWRMLLLRGVLGGLSVLTYFWAIERLGAAPATVLNYSSPVYAAVFGAWFLKERSTWLKRGGLALATLGSVLVALQSAKGAWLSPDVGAVSGVLSAVFGGAAITTIRKLRDDTDAVTVFLAFCVVGGLVSLPLSVPVWVPLSGRALGLCLAVGVLSIGGQMLFTWGMGFTTATRGSATTQLAPAVAWVLAITVLAEPISGLGAFGALCCVTGVMVGVVRFSRTFDAGAEPRFPQQAE